MKLRWMVQLAVITFLIAFFSVFLAQRDSATAANSGTDKIEGTLIDELASGGRPDFILHFSQQADLSPAYSMDWQARGEFVYNTLRELAQSSQAGVKGILDARGLSYQTFIAGNELYVWGGKGKAAQGLNSAQELNVLNELAAMPEVASIRATRTYTIDPTEQVTPLEQISWAGDQLATEALTTVISSTSASMDWGITDTKANQFWSQFKAEGSGILVASIDTGVQWDHPALKQAYKCNINPSDPKCWFDPAKICSGTAPCDNNGHGTHTMGTMVGDNDPKLPYIVGMAPEAQWIACKGCEDKACSDFALNACAEWVLAPGGDPANRPNIVNNSWGGDIGGDNWFAAKVQAWRAAGIFPAFSAGNAGSACNTLTSPGDYQESFGSAAHDSSRNIANFSSRGPSAYGNNPFTKPNISAPGVSICSSIPGNNWSCGYSGTSMASPHTAGAVALLWSCNPSLVGQIDTTFMLLQNTADTPPAGNCSPLDGGQGNYTYGYGYLDVLAAGKSTCNIISQPDIAANLQSNDTQTISMTLNNTSVPSLTWNLKESPAVPWLSEEPLSGTISLAEQQVITITFNTKNLPIGQYKTKLVINSNNPYTPSLSIPVFLRVGRVVYLPLLSKH